MTIQMQDVESELSYAYLHAVASKANFACEAAGRLSDNHGIDATVRVFERLNDNSILTDFTIDIQIKATIRDLPESNRCFSFSLPVKQYDKLRSETAANQKLLLLFQLPDNPDEWLNLTEEQLVMRRCAYWVSLRGAGPVTSDTQQSITVRVPKANVFSPEALREVATVRSQEEYINYEN